MASKMGQPHWRGMHSFGDCRDRLSPGMKHGLRNGVVVWQPAAASLGWSRRPRSSRQALTSMSSWGLGYVPMLAAFGPFSRKHKSGPLRHTRSVFGLQPLKSGPNLTSYSPLWIHDCDWHHNQRSDPPQCTVHPWLYNEGGNNWFKTERAERVFCGPVVVRENDGL